MPDVRRNTVTSGHFRARDVASLNIKQARVPRVTLTSPPDAYMVCLEDFYALTTAVPQTETTCGRVPILAL